MRAECKATKSVESKPYTRESKADAWRAAADAVALALLRLSLPLKERGDLGG